MDFVPKIFEELLLNSLATYSPSTTTATVKPPRLYTTERLTSRCWRISKIPMGSGPCCSLPTLTTFFPRPAQPLSTATWGFGFDPFTPGLRHQRKLLSGRRCGRTTLCGRSSISSHTIAFSRYSKITRSSWRVTRRPWTPFEVPWQRSSRGHRQRKATITVSYTEIFGRESRS